MKFLGNYYGGYGVKHNLQKAKQMLEAAIAMGSTYAKYSYAIRALSRNNNMSYDCRMGYKKGYATWL